MNAIVVKSATVVRHIQTSFTENTCVCMINPPYAVEYYNHYTNGRYDRVLHKAGVTKSESTWPCVA